MSVIYFTSSADAGDGTLRSAIASAKSGDVIMPSPAIADNLVTIQLQSVLSINRSITLQGGSNRVRLDGQSNVRLVQVSSAVSVAFEDFDFVYGKNSSCGGIATTTNGANLTLNRCLLAGNENGGTVGDIGSPSSSYHWGNVTINDSICCGSSTQLTLTSRIDGTFKVNRCTVVGNAIYTTYRSYATDSIIVNDYSLPGFIVPPTTPNTWSPTAWTNWDLRLRPDSTYLSGGTTGETDFYGHPRDESGALGAITGSWLVTRTAEESNITEDTIVDYGDLIFDIHIADDKFLTIKNIYKSKPDNEELPRLIEATNKAYFSSNDNSVFEFSNVVATSYGAKVNLLEARKESIEWSAENPEISVLLEKQDNGVWTTITTDGTNGSYETPLEYGAIVRIFDGERFIEATLEIPVSYYEIAESCSIGYILAEDGRIGYIQ